MSVQSSLQNSLPACVNKASSSFLAQTWGGPEDHDMDVHPPGVCCVCVVFILLARHYLTPACRAGCRHAPGRQSILGLSETWATRMVGGMHAIHDTVTDMEKQMDSRSSLSHMPTRVDMSLHDLVAHSTMLFCDVCMKSSVVSFENYRDVMGKSRGMHMQNTGDSGDPGKHGNKMGIYACMQTPQEYYLYVAMTRGLLRTPCFARMSQVDDDGHLSPMRRNREMDSSSVMRRVPIPAIVIPDAEGGNLAPHVHVPPPFSAPAFSAPDLERGGVSREREREIRAMIADISNGI